MNAILDHTQASSHHISHGMVIQYSIRYRTVPVRFLLHFLLRVATRPDHEADEVVRWEFLDWDVQLLGLALLLVP